MISIRRINEEDIDIINSMSNGDIFNKSVHATKSELANDLYNTTRKIIAVMCNNSILGYVNILINDKDATYTFYIDENVNQKEKVDLINNSLMFGFQELNLNNVFISNDKYNELLINSCSFEKNNENELFISKDTFIDSFKKQEKDMTNVKRRYFKEITDNRGDLIALENPSQLEFPLNRIYYIYNVDEGIERGKHSHYDLEQMLICVSGCVTIITKTPYEEQQYILNSPNEGLYIGPMIWREMHHFSDDAVLLVLASRKYDANDYIRDYDQYVEEATKYFKR